MGSEYGSDFGSGNASAANASARPGAREAIDRTVSGLGYDVVDVERSGRGLLRIFIDRQPGRSYPTGAGESIMVEDCELVTRQLQYALEVAAVAYERLEVSSPGLDRPLKRSEDYERFVGAEVAVTLKLPFKGRKIWRGLLARAESGWSLVLNDGKEDQALAFSLDEVREARLVPMVDFKGRSKNVVPATQDMAQQPGVDGGQDR